MYVIGTAGHVDHGKTSLVHALTGVDTDRLPEEKKRGLTIELGFASFPGADGEPIGVIDVPGHERFIRNMVSGAWALQCALLTVAADDGWMKQTEDHARVLQGMGTPAIVLVITKIDLVDTLQLAAVQQDALSRCVRIFGYQPPHVNVCAPAGKGLAELKAVLIQQLSLRKDRRSFPLCLYIDRVFTLQGTGTVVAGTLAGGTLAIGDEVSLLPEGTRVKIRSLQSHGAMLREVSPFARTAVTLQGLKPELVRRGSCLGTADGMEVAKSFIAVLTGVHPEEAPALRNHQELEIAYGTRHTLASVHTVKGEGIDGDSPILIVRMVVQDPVVCFWNQSFLGIRPGGSDILCFGRFLWLGALENPEARALARMVQRQRGVPQALCAQFHVELLLKGYADRKAPVQGGLRLLDRDFTAVGAWYVENERLLRCEQEISQQADRIGGVTCEEVKTNTSLPAEVTSACVARLVAAKKVYLTKQVLTVSPPQEKTLSESSIRFLERARDAGLQGLEVKSLSREDKEQLRALTREGYLIVLDGTLVYTMDGYREMVAKVLLDKPKGTLFSIADAKIHLPLSRKYIIPLLNRMEEEKLVERRGDMRLVR